MKSILSSAILAVAFGALGLASQSKVIPHVVDGGGWSTTVVLTNTTSSAAIASLTFRKDDTRAGGGKTVAWNPPLVEGGSTAALQLAAGSTMFLHTRGTDSQTSQGWTELDTTDGVEGYAIYTLHKNTAPDDDVTVLAAEPTNRILAAYDNTGGLITAFAIANPNSSAVTISVKFRAANGTVTTGSLPSVPAMGHTAFVLGTQFPATAGRHGLAEFYTNSGTFSMIALRMNTEQGYASVPVYLESGPPIIQGGTGGGNIVSANFSISKLAMSAGGQNMTMEQVGGMFARYTPEAWNKLYSGTTFGSCIVSDSTYSGSTDPSSSPFGSLDAGTIGISGPNLPSGSVLMKMPSASGPSYMLQVANGTLGSGGRYTLTGQGGTEVASFTASATMPSNFSVTNWNAITAIDRTKALTVNWTGTGFDKVIITAGASTQSGASTHAVAIACVVPASLGTFAVPITALSKLPAVPAGSRTGSAMLQVMTVVDQGGSVSVSASKAKTLTPNLVAGGKVDYGSFMPFQGVMKEVTVN